MFPHIDFIDFKVYPNDRGQNEFENTSGFMDGVYIPLIRQKNLHLETPEFILIRYHKLSR